MTAAQSAPTATTSHTADRLARVRDEVQQLRTIIARVERAARENTDDDAP